jgi:carboxypeptidase Q
MDLATELVDGIGPRLTGTSNMKLANEWAMKRLAGWGLSNARLEKWGPFGRGWEYQESAVRMLAPDRAELLALPEAWTPGTDHAVRGQAVRVDATTKEELEKYRGKLSGRVVFFGEMPEIKPHEKAEAERYDDKGLEELSRYEIPGKPRRFDREAYRKRRQLRRAADKFFAEEKAVAVVTASRRENALAVQATHSGWKKDEAAPLPGLVMSVEHFGRVARLLERNVAVELELDVRTRFLDADPMQSNVVAEIPGTERRLEIVMLGAHLDSWHAGTGATDNAAGCAVVLEAFRILKALGLPMDRTVRLALWGGEEQALFGSRGYVKEHFGDPVTMALKPEHAKLAGYFNVDNGTGKIRGVYLQGNDMARPIFEAWLGPFRDLGATTISIRNTGGTDHESFDAVGLPGFQFIQDPLDYASRTHHSSLDVYDHVQSGDLMQASAVLASFVYGAAVRPDKLPRKPLPKALPPKKAEAISAGG